ncbi:MAG: response regulator transcription factor [Opitutales bacterium]
MKSILIVDDMTGVREAMTVLLEVAGYKVSTAQNGEEGFQKAASSQFDLIITDILMPELDGNEMIMKIREAAKTTPIVAMSAGGNGVASEAALSLSKELGITTLEKPFSKAQLLDLVNTILNAPAAC